MNDSNSSDGAPQATKVGKLKKEYGRSGTLIHGGIITQEEYNNNLVGKNAIKTYDTMRRSDATVRAMLQVCKLPLLGADWYLEPASEDANDVAIKEKIEKDLFHGDISFHRFLSEALTMFDFGFSVFEVVAEYKEIEKIVGIKKLAWRKQTSIYKWETEDKKEGITQQLIGSTISIPREKLVIFTHEKEGDNYEGISMLRHAYKHWNIKDKLDIVNAMALEKMAIGVPVLKTPTGAEEASKQAARETLAEMRANQKSYIDIPEGWEVEMLDMKANSTKDVLPTITYHDLQIVKSVLAQFLELGQNASGGSRALSTDQTRLFEKSLESAANNIANTIQIEIINKLCDINFSNMPNGYPKIKFGKLGDDNLVELADSVQKLATANMINPDADLEDHLRKLYRLPKLPKELKDNYPEKTITEPTLQPKSLPEQTAKPTKANALKRASQANRELIDILTRG